MIKTMLFELVQCLMFQLAEKL